MTELLGPLSACNLPRQREQLPPGVYRATIAPDDAPDHGRAAALLVLDASGLDGTGVIRQGGDLGRIRDLHIAYYRQVRAIAAASEPTDIVALLNAHLVELT